MGEKAVMEKSGDQDVHMGNCGQCGSPWSMTGEQYQWWITVGKEKALKLPKHCQACRDLRKRPMSVRLYELADRIGAEEFDYGDRELIKAVQEFAMEAEEYERRRRQHAQEKAKRHQSASGPN